MDDARVGALLARLDELERRVRLLDDEAEMAQLIAGYGPPPAVPTRSGRRA